MGWLRDRFGGWSANMVGGSISGTSLNPARTFGPAVFSEVWDTHWVFWVGLIIGAVIAAVVYEFLFIRPKNE